MTRFRPENLFTPNATTFVHSALATVGIQDETSGYLPHAIQASGVVMCLVKYLSDCFACISEFGLGIGDLSYSDCEWLFLSDHCGK